LALIFSLILTVGWGSKTYAATSVTGDLLPDDVGRTSIEKAGAPSAGEVNAASHGNPLWFVPLSALKATRERPMFSTSRRPPPARVLAPRIEPAIVAIAQKAPEPEHPSLALIGSMVGDSNAVAVFLDHTTQGIVRLRAGEVHDGWMLSSILQREVTLKKASQVEVLFLQRTNDPVGISGNPRVPIIPGLLVPPMRPTQEAGELDTAIPNLIRPRSQFRQ
jgi:general secretion pathway protein N